MERLKFHAFHEGLTKSFTPLRYCETILPNTTEATSLVLGSGFSRIGKWLHYIRGKIGGMKWGVFYSESAYKTL